MSLRLRVRVSINTTMNITLIVVIVLIVLCTKVRPQEAGMMDSIPTSVRGGFPFFGFVRVFACGVCLVVVGGGESRERQSGREVGSTLGGVLVVLAVRADTKLRGIT